MVAGLSVLIGVTVVTYSSALSHIALVTMTYRYRRPSSYATTLNHVDTTTVNGVAIDTTSTLNEYDNNDPFTLISSLAATALLQSDRRRDAVGGGPTSSGDA